MSPFVSLSQAIPLSKPNAKPLIHRFVWVFEF
jgi:hypothetical protein